ncbi:MAG: hypothetical protein M1269_00350 [Chloroflexi bacterium]|nr:hypothetical protein [Chloroflexota bacterium]
MEFENDNYINELSKKTNIILEAASGQIPRLLSLLDRNPGSKTRGCFDRSYWHYRERDFPAASFQNGTLVVALCYKNNFQGNSLYNNPLALSWALDGLEFWCSCQGPGGSFAEWYPKEPSYVVTAFTAHAAAETYNMLKDEIPGDLRKKLEDTLSKAGRFLASHEDLDAANHAAGGAAALFTISEALGEPKFRKSAEKLLGKILERQNPEGWFPEYRGADGGYQSLTIDYLSRIYEVTGDEILFESLVRACNFLEYMTYPDGTCGGETGSRSTRFIMPRGLVRLHEKIDSAKRMLGRLACGIEKGSAFTPGISDDRYLAFFFLPNFLQAGLEIDAVPPCFPMPEFENIFSASGILAVHAPNYFLSANLKKGAALRLYNGGGEFLYSGGGYTGRAGDRLISTHSVDPEAAWTQEKRGNETIIRVTSNFHYAGETRLSPGKSILLRLFSILFGWIPGCAFWLQKYLRSRLVWETRPAPAVLSREIRYSNESVTINDVIETETGISGIASTREIPTMLSPTAPWFFISDSAMTTDARIERNIGPGEKTGFSQAFNFSLSGGAE